VADEKRTQQFRGEQETIDRDSHLDVHQGNIGSFMACLNELRSWLEQENPMWQCIKMLVLRRMILVPTPGPFGRRGTETLQVQGGTLIRHITKEPLTMK
jgi:hypothetical protein